MNKKLSGAAAAVIGALLLGGAQVLDHEERIQQLEAELLSGQELELPSGQELEEGPVEEVDGESAKDDDGGLPEESGQEETIDPESGTGE